MFWRDFAGLTRNIFTVDEIDYLDTQWIIWDELVRLKYIFRDVYKKCIWIWVIALYWNFDEAWLANEVEKKIEIFPQSLKVLA